MSDCIAVLNSGSSSIKLGIFEAGAGEPVVFRGKLDQIGIAPCLRIENARGSGLVERKWSSAFDHYAAATEVIDACRELLQGRPVAAIGHRVVHGGAEFAAPTRIDQDVIASLDKLVPLAPLHQPINLASIRAVAEAAPNIPQVACFDTAFHSGQPRLAQLFAIPREYTQSGIRRYGFHGLSYEYVVSRLKETAPELASSRVVIAHLGNGASLCAVSGGRSIATTMGFTAADGLVMGTRCGAIDPGVLIYLMDRYGMDARSLEDLIYRRSGLLGVSGVSSDMRQLRSSSDASAAEAIALFVYRIVREIGSLVAALGGVDGIVFTGGIGENDVATRAEIAAGCQWLGLELDPGRNGQGSGRISTDSSRIASWVVPTDEERMIARHTGALLGLPG
jgi:acetate kinase